MPSKKEARPAVESKRASDQTIQESVTPWTPQAQAALIALAVLFAVAGAILTVIP